MSSEKNTINSLGNRYNELYTNNSTFFNEISRSYSAGIDEPNVSPNLLRVYSRNNLYSQGSLRVRSSPSSPNRLSRIQCMTPVHKKWSALAKVHISSSSELELPNSQNSENSHKSCDFTNSDQLDIPSINLLPTSAPSSRDTSWRNLRPQNNPSIRNFNYETLPFSKSFDEKVTNRLTKHSSYTIDDIKIENSMLSSHQFEETDDKTQDFPNQACKLSPNPVNFKKVLRDRYLKSQKMSQFCTINTLSNAISSQNKHQQKSESLSSEPEDHNFNFIQDSDSRFRHGQTEEYHKNLSSDLCRTKNALSLDLINLNMPKKYRIKSNNSTVSSVSGIESESDPFSPASTEICSPFLKLNFPYRNNNSNIKETESLNRNLIPSSSLSALSSVNETENSYVKSQEFGSAQRFFPDTMKISDFSLAKSSKSDTGDSRNIQRHLILPDLSNSRQNSQSAPNSIEIISDFNKQSSRSLSPNNTNSNSAAIYSQSTASLECPVYSPSYTNDVRRISNSRSMDHINSYVTRRNNNEISKSFDNNVSKFSKSEKLEKCDNKSTLENTTHNLRRKTKALLNCVSNSKKVLHLQKTANQRQCNVCGRHFNRSDMLARHMRVHTGHKPFECTICGQSFSRSDHLNTHLRIHSGEKPYQCSICSYSACRRDMITRHLRVHKRKGDIVTETGSSLVVNVNKQKTTQHKKKTKLKAQSSLNIDPNAFNDMKETLSSLYRSRSFTDDGGCNDYKDLDVSLRSDSTMDRAVLPPRTFANISISISQPTPRSSFSIPMETQNY